MSFKKQSFLGLLLMVATISLGQAKTSDSTVNNLVLPKNYKTAVYGAIPEYIKKGHGKQAMILIPGLGFDASIFSDFMLANQKDYTMYAITIAGYGNTQAPPMPVTDSSYGLQYWNKSIILGILKLMEEEKIIKPVIAGYFVQGTQLALRMAIDHPGSVAGIVTIGGPAKFILIQQGVPKEFPLKNSIAYIDKYTSQQFFKTISQDEFNTGNYLPEIYSRDEKKGNQLWKQSANVPLPVIVRYLCEFFASDITLEFDKIKCPVMILRPAFDSTILNKTVNNYVQPQFIDAWDKAAKTNSLLIVKDIRSSSSCIWKDQPEKFNMEIANFIKMLR